MPWLRHTSDEVNIFHPEFESAVNETLREMGLQESYRWIHHYKTVGNSLVPDYVLLNSARQWIIAVEIKRTRADVFSTRYQIQAKSYAEENRSAFPATSPRYFAITNLESTLLFAINEGRPVNECRLQEGLFNSGDFIQGTSMTHRNKFIQDWIQIINRVTSSSIPLFDTVWPGVLSDWLSCSASIPTRGSIAIPEPTTPNWTAVRDYFSESIYIDSARIFLLRCLIAEYLRGTLIRYGHPQGDSIPPVLPDKARVGNTIDALRTIDFKVIFEDFSANIYRSLDDPILVSALMNYINLMTEPGRKIVDFARTRLDSTELVDSIFTALHPVETQAIYGKVQTDPELAAILACLTINGPVNHIMDPCCGDGVLLSAAYDRLIQLGIEGSAACSSLRGIEVDPISVRLSSLQISLKQPASVSPANALSIVQGDLFCSSDEIGQANVILMNPPFKRYEAQDERPVPIELRQHYANAIENVDGEASLTIGGQANLFNYYVEYVGKSVTDNTVLGIILDNRWYHNRYGESLRTFIKNGFLIIGIVEYPHSVFFAGLTIATSIVIMRKSDILLEDHRVKFIRCKVDPRGVDFNVLSACIHGRDTWPTDWSCREVRQADLDPKIGWKSYFTRDLDNNYRSLKWPKLGTLFRQSRRGSLEKEGGGTSVFQFPFNRRKFGNQRIAITENRRRFQTEKGRALTNSENILLREYAAGIPAEYRGYAIKNADRINNYELTEGDVNLDQTLEPPTLREHRELFLNGRSDWTVHHDLALEEIYTNPLVRRYADGVDNIIGLREGVLSREELWHGLCEPIAGELIIPRKMRAGHRVHINQHYFNPADRQIRISSNFITFMDCQAYDDENGLDRLTAVRLIAAYLISSYGQLQFEMEGYNREGVLSVEDEHLQKIHIFDPRWISPELRQSIIEAFHQLPYPILTDRLSPSQPERNRLDALFTEAICARHPEMQADQLLVEVHNALDEWIDARQP